MDLFVVFNILYIIVLVGSVVNLSVVIFDRYLVCMKLFSYVEIIVKYFGMIVIFCWIIVVILVVFLVFWFDSDVVVLVLKIY